MEASQQPDGPGGFTGSSLEDSPRREQSRISLGNSPKLTLARVTVRGLRGGLKRRVEGQGLWEESDGAGGPGYIQQNSRRGLAETPQATSCESP